MGKLKPQDWVRTWIEIDKRSLFSNFEYFRKRAKGKGIIAMIKSNAYGHGLVTIARLLADSDFGFRISDFRESRLWFGVDSMTEALRLREEGVKNPILVLGYTLPRRLKEAARKNIIVTVSSFDGLNDFLKLRIRPEFHIKLDTGMHRQGFQESDIPDLIRRLRKSRIVPDGIYSHLAEASNTRFSTNQIHSFERALELFEKAGIRPRVLHFNKTEGIMNFPEAMYDMVRLGIGLYGYYPEKGIRLKPVLTWKTIVSEVKRIERGAWVSYDRTERVRRDSTIAVLPVGYWHGFDRGLSSTGKVLVHGRRARVLGRVTMDMTMVDVTDIPGIRVRDEVVIIGKQGNERVTADDIAKKIGTVSYEVITRINPLIRKIVI